MINPPPVDLDAIESLLKRIRSAEADVARLYTEMRLLLSVTPVAQGSSVAGHAPAQSNGHIPSRHVPVPRSGSNTGKVLAHLRAYPATTFEPESFVRVTGETDVKKLKGILEKLVFRGYAERMRPGKYRLAAGGDAETS